MEAAPAASPRLAPCPGVPKKGSTPKCCSAPCPRHRCAQLGRAWPSHGDGAAGHGHPAGRQPAGGSGKMSAREDEHLPQRITNATDALGEGTRGQTGGDRWATAAGQLANLPGASPRRGTTPAPCNPVTEVGAPHQPLPSCTPRRCS